jgi:hypothetical protein
MGKRTIKQIENEMREESLIEPCIENGWRGPDDAKILRLQTERNELTKEKK